MSAYFNNTTQKAMDGNVKDTLLSSSCRTNPIERDGTPYRPKRKRPRKSRPSTRRGQRTVSSVAARSISGAFSRQMPADEPELRALMDDGGCDLKVSGLRDRKMPALKQNAAWQEGFRRAQLRLIGAFARKCFRRCSAATPRNCSWPRRVDVDFFLGSFFWAGRRPSRSIGFVRHDDDRRRVFSHSVHRLLRRVIEVRRHRIKLLLRKAIDCDRGKRRNGGYPSQTGKLFRSGRGVEHIILIIDCPAFARRDVATIESAGDLLLQACDWEASLRELFDGELIESLVLIEALMTNRDRPHLAIVIDVNAIGIGIARSVEPVTARCSPQRGEARKRSTIFS